MKAFRAAFTRKGSSEEKSKNMKSMNTTSSTSDQKVAQSSISNTSESIKNNNVAITVTGVDSKTEVAKSNKNEFNTEKSDEIKSSKNDGKNLEGSSNDKAKEEDLKTEVSSGKTNISGKSEDSKGKTEIPKAPTQAHTDTAKHTTEVNSKTAVSQKAEILNPITEISTAKTDSSTSSVKTEIEKPKTNVSNEKTSTPGNTENAKVKSEGTNAKTEVLKPETGISSVKTEVYTGKPEVSQPDSSKSKTEPTALTTAPKTNIPVKTDGAKSKSEVSVPKTDIQKTEISPKNVSSIVTPATSIFSPAQGVTKTEVSKIPIVSTTTTISAQKKENQSSNIEVKEVKNTLMDKNGQNEKLPKTPSTDKISNNKNQDISSNKLESTQGMKMEARGDSQKASTKCQSNVSSASSNNNALKGSTKMGESSDTGQIVDPSEKVSSVETRVQFSDKESKSTTEEKGKSEAAAKQDLQGQNQSSKSTDESATMASSKGIGADVADLMSKIEAAGFTRNSSPSDPSVSVREGVKKGGNKNNTPKSAKSTSPTFSSSLYRPTTSSSLKGVQNSPAVSPLAVPLVNTENFYQVGGAIYSKRPKSATPAAPFRKPIQATRTSLTTRPKTAKPRCSTEMGDTVGEGGAGDKKATFKDQFAAFARFGDPASDGKQITLSNSDKWMKQAKVIDAKKITTTDTSIGFKKLFKTQKKVGLADYKKFVEDLANSKKMKPEELLEKMTNCGAPGLSTNTRAASGGVIDRLTDTSRYTGSHKERFDASGKGKGIEGRRDVGDSSGYTAAFKTKLETGGGAAGDASPATS